MTAAVWQSNTSTSGNGTTTGATVSVPGGVANGDLLILTVSTGTNSNTGAVAHTTPSGWTLIQSASRGGTRVSAYWRIAASEPADYSPAWASQTGGHLLTINRFTGAASSSPIDVSSTANGNGSTATAATVTTTVADALLVCVYAHPATGGNKFSQPSGMSEKWDLAGTGSNGPGSALDTETITSAGATGSRASTLSFGDNWGALAFAIKPSAGTTYNVSLSGTLTTDGSAAKQDQKPLSGTLTSSGAVVKQVGKALAGALTSAGAVTTLKAVLQTFTGTLTSSGTLTRRTGKALNGTLTSSGGLARVISKGLTGTLTTAGAATKQLARRLTGTLTSAGSLVAQAIGTVVTATRARSSDSAVGTATATDSAVGGAASTDAEA